MCSAHWRSRCCRLRPLTKADRVLEKHPECLSYPCNASAPGDRGLFLWRTASGDSGMAHTNQPRESVSEARSPAPWFDVPRRNLRQQRLQTGVVAEIAKHTD